MKKLALVAVALVASSSFAQEIGTEITPVTPTSGATNTNTNTNNANPNNANSGNANANSNTTGSSAYKPKPREGEKTFEGAAVSAQGGAFGLRGGFGASGATGIPVGNNAFIGAPFVGVAYFATDAFKLLIDVGFGFNLSNNFSYAIAAAFGFDFLLRSPGDALRPFIHFAGLFTMAGASGDPLLGFGAQVGFGAEYFFSPNFSLNGRLMIVAPMAVSGSGFSLAIMSVTPGVGATWYF